jgi:ABC-2 type transport system ATP-binding protein
VLTLVPGTTSLFSHFFSNVQWEAVSILIMPSSETILSFSHLTKIYRHSSFGRITTTLGIQDLSLEIKKGEIFGLLGLNGAGKTTTLKTILGLLFPTSGTIVFNGRPMPNQESIQQIGFLPEMPYFPKHLSVEEVLYFYGTLSAIPKQELQNRVMDVLTRVRMQPNKTKRIRDCSKGMLQRVSLAQALIHNPPFLVFDEPITGLDPLGLTEMREMILELNSHGKTILFSSHSIAEVERIANRVGILAYGKLVQVLNSQAWLGQPGTLEKMFVETVRPFGESPSE